MQNNKTYTATDSENSIYHGIEYMVDEGQIKIKAKKKMGCFC